MAKKIGFDLDEDEVESIFSLDDEPNQETLIALNIEDSSKDELQDLFKISPTKQPSNPIPLTPVQLYPNKWSKPILIIALLDIEAHYSILNLDVLPSYLWKTNQKFFRATDNQIFSTNLITKHPHQYLNPARL